MISLLIGASVAFCLLMTPALIVVHYDAKRAKEAEAAAHSNSVGAAHVH